MTKPKATHFKKAKLEERKEYPNGVVYEHWHDTIDNYHHVHLLDGMTIYFGHEDGEGSVDIEEASDD